MSLEQKLISHITIMKVGTILSTVAFALSSSPSAVEAFSRSTRYCSSDGLQFIPDPECGQLQACGESGLCDFPICAIEDAAAVTPE